MNTLTNQYHLSKLKRILRKINKLATKMATLTDEELAYQTIIFKQRLEKGETEDDILPEAYAAIREADKRILGKYPYDVQVLGAIALHQCNVAEMRTGEGKTLTATLPLYLNALSGKGAMLIAPNEYLAHRDKEEMGPVFEFMGLTVALGFKYLADKDDRLTEEELKSAYYADILYQTNSGLGFDYLIHNLVSKKEEQFMRAFNFVVVDEIDAVLLDMAQTPLVISGAPRAQSNLYKMCNYLVQSLVLNDDYLLDDSKSSVWLTQEGINKAERFFQREKLYQFKNHDLIRHVGLALRAHHLFTKNENYVVDDGEVKLLDLENGRVVEGVKLQAGQHQAIEAKEEVDITEDQRAIASITLQNLFKLFPKLSGMTGTGKVVEQEFLTTYGMSVIQIPTNKPMIRIDHPDKAYMSFEEKTQAILEHVKEEYARKRPLLIVAGNVDVSNYFSHLLLKEGIPHNLLNAVNVAKESEIIAEAGRSGSVTLATSMAGRGTDIKLDEAARSLGGLLVIGTEQMKNKRTDLQLRGRAGRQGDPGESQFYICLEDKIIETFGPQKVQKMIEKKKKTGKFNKNFSHKKISRISRRAQILSDDAGEQSRQMSLELDDSMKMQRTLVYEQREELMENAQVQDIVNDAQRMVFTKFMQNNPNSNEINRFILDMITYNGFDSTKIDKVSDLTKLFNSVLEEKRKQLSNSEYFEKFLRIAVLKSVDEMWVEQVDALQQIKTLISGREYAQLNAAFEYHTEALRSFKKMQEEIKHHIVRNVALSTVSINQKDGNLIILFP